MKILILNGPNLNLLGKREPEIYGSDTLEDIEKSLKEKFPGIDFQWEQSNSEGRLIDILQASDADGVIFNPGAFTHYSYALFDCIKAVENKFPVVEVHISNVHRREKFRRKSVIAPACAGTVSGLGTKGYELAVRWFVDK